MCIAQQLNTEQLQGWHLRDKGKEGFVGISLIKALQFLETQKATPVVVAVLDGGVDTLHEDLVNKLWKNPKEIPDNGIDDDNNGYVDDVYGWNFLGNSKGENILKETNEYARVYHQLKNWYDINKNDTNCLKIYYPDTYNLWVKVNSFLDISADEKMNYNILKTSTDNAIKYEQVLKAEIGTDDFSASVLESYAPKTDKAKRAKVGFLNYVKIFEIDREKNTSVIFSEVNSFLEKKKNIIFAKDSPIVNYRKMIIGDDEDDLTVKNYGNSNVMASVCRHGTHVSGIIAAERGNHVGIDGICNDAKIMTVRVVPDGDEHDKDVALGIRYAVNNGAKVINMSFGKNLSPQKKMVDEAIMYAAEKDVLIIKAAGNESLNLNKNSVYPSKKLSNNKVAENIITVGSSSDWHIDSTLVAGFTNYGNAYVDILAPGNYIYSTISNTDKSYGFENGTSMSSPIVAGIAALIRSYYPTLTAVEVKKCILASADTSYIDEVFLKPGSAIEKISMREVCATGGIVNAYNAVLLANELYLNKQRVVNKKK
ncbi:S8 family serine peptidase [Polluticaenibacter yanchengensis]|uniref:S8 family serine peptidase n=1 Tax=Polluticaenibacter yanchengensis TaxID=3014562 RepID=A0ABT4UKQ4_9BACT|nr:S8 family serine peptidase [Chitinophagaceae bacterium LY-5]